MRYEGKARFKCTRRGDGDNETQVRHMEVTGIKGGRQRQGGQHKILLILKNNQKIRTD